MMNQILIQTIYYFIVLVLAFFIIGIMQKGFFMNFVRVKLSFGRLIMCKIRAINRDYYRTGEVEGEFLVFKSNEGEKRITIPDSSVFYRSIGGLWVDVDEQRNALIKVNYTAAPGFDAVKYNNLLVRALTRPGIIDNQDKIIFASLFLIAVLVAAVAFFVYKQGVTMEMMAAQVAQLKSGIITNTAQV